MNVPVNKLKDDCIRMFLRQFIRKVVTHFVECDASLRDTITQSLRNLSKTINVPVNKLKDDCIRMFHTIY